MRTLYRLNNEISWTMRLRRFWRNDDAAWRMIALSVLVGVVAGLGAIAFYVLLDLARWLLLDHIAGYHETGPEGEATLFAPSGRSFSRWALFALPAIGGLISGWLVHRFAPDAAGHGTDAAIRNYHRSKTDVRWPLPLIKAVASAIVIGSGGSGGREGPIAQIGSAFGAILGRRLGLTRKECRTLMIAGLAGGVGAIFHAPMAGAIFGAEVLYRDMDMEYEAILPSIVSSVVAYAVFTAVFGWNPLFTTPDFRFQNAFELLPYLGLALVVALGAKFYTATFYAVHRMFARLRWHPALKPALGGLIVGCIGLAVPAALGTGYGVIQEALNGEAARPLYVGGMGVGFLLAVVVAKTLTTSFSIGSGGSGGVFGPAIVIGGALGAAFALLFNATGLAPNVEPGAFVVVGMAGFFAAAANTPLSTIIMVGEMTGNYHLLVPSLWVCTIAYLLCRHTHLYVEQIQNRFQAPVHLENMMAAVLRNRKVGDLLRQGCRTPVAMVAHDTPFADLRDRFTRMTASSFALCDAAGRLEGIVRARDIRAAFDGSADGAPVSIAADLAIPSVSVAEDDTLLTALAKMLKHDLDEIVVLASGPDAHIVGALSHRNIADSYWSDTEPGSAAPAQSRPWPSAPR